MSVLERDVEEMGHNMHDVPAFPQPDDLFDVKRTVRASPACRSHAQVVGLEGVVGLVVDALIGGPSSSQTALVLVLLGLEATLLAVER